MKISRRARTIILWLVSIGLLAGMVVTFTPTLGLGFGGRGDTSAVALRVNGEPVRELRVAQLRANPLFLAVTEGEVGADLELLLVDTLIRQEVVRQQSARQRVSDADVRRAVDEFRVSRGISGRANDAQYLNLLARSGFTDETFRVYLRQQLQEERWQASVTAEVEVSDAEVRAYYEGNRNAYLSEERIEARHIVTLERDAALVARARIVDGEDAGVVAREVSVERADRDGALGAAAGETNPRPVGRPALPTAVASAAFGLRGAGVTEVVEADGRYHLVVVEAYLPALPRPFEEVAATVRDDALAAKRAGVLEQEIERLVADARIEVPADSSLSFEDRPVARVGDVEIMATDLVRATYTNPQIQQALSPDSAFIITAFFKPAILAQLVDQELALKGVADLGVPFVGTRAMVAQSALNYVAREAVADDEAVASYYEQNRVNYTVPASAIALQVEVPTLDAAVAFRGGLLAEGLDAEGDVDALAERVGAEVDDLGLVVPGQLTGLLDLTLFGTDAFDDVPGGPWQVSDVLVLNDQARVLPEELDVSEEADAEEVGEPLERPADRYVLLVAERRPERVRPLAEVRGQIETTVLAEARAGLREAWIDELRERVEVDLLVDDGAAAQFDFGLPLEEDLEALEQELEGLDGDDPDADAGVEPEADTDGQGEPATE